MARVAGDWPSARATSLKRRTWPSRAAAAPPSTMPCNHSMPGRPSRASAGMPWSYLPVNRPEASGEKMVVPRPARAYSGAYSTSTRSRCSRLYCGCSIDGPCRLCASAMSSACWICAADHSEVPQ
ncbi:hypothetical protein G6F53_013967 [Rhizopus delemar]|nr:hypothetical protein G6F53_013967 [Rhizopus delemar]